MINILIDIYVKHSVHQFQFLFQYIEMDLHSS